jgi:hypothetical protein
MAAGAPELSNEGHEGLELLQALVGRQFQVFDDQRAVDVFLVRLDHGVGIERYANRETIGTDHGPYSTIVIPRGGMLRTRADGTPGSASWKCGKTPRSADARGMACSASVIESMALADVEGGVVKRPTFHA